MNRQIAILSKSHKLKKQQEQTCKRQMYEAAVFLKSCKLMDHVTEVLCW
uniref:Bm1116 n=1 Tax=Brugia malayi TaxID=6279 RepID=A0A1I9G421_BRUMA|nr:Bm1116 [Brugia malayi]